MIQSSILQFVNSRYKKKHFLIFTNFLYRPSAWISVTSKKSLLLLNLFCQNIIPVITQEALHLESHWISKQLNLIVSNTKGHPYKTHEV